MSKTRNSNLSFYGMSKPCGALTLAKLAGAKGMAPSSPGPVTAYRTPNLDLKSHRKYMRVLGDLQQYIDGILLNKSEALHFRTGWRLGLLPIPLWTSRSSELHLRACMLL